MEMIIASAAGSSAIPNGCFVNVNVGDVQKQAAFNPKKLYRFSELRRFAKIDVYRLVGSCDFSWSADGSETHTCTPVGVEGDTGLRFSVTAKKADTLKDSKQGVAKDPKEESSQQARQYLKEHGVEALFTAAIKALLKVQPQDSRRFIADFITGSDAKSARPAASQQKKPPPASAPAQEEEVVDIPDNEETNAAALKMQSIQRGKNTRKEVQAKRADKSPQAKAPPPKGPPPAARQAQPRDDVAVRAAACDALLKASADGELDQVLRDMQKERPKGEKDVRATACNALLKASLDGDLDKVMREIHEERPKGERDVRATACNALLKASLDGELDKVMRDIRAERPNKAGPRDDSAVRDAACDALLKASADGELDKVLRQLKQERPQEEVVDIPDNEETNAAAAKMQAIQRGKNARKEVGAKRAEKALPAAGVACVPEVIPHYADKVAMGLTRAALGIKGHKAAEGLMQAAAERVQAIRKDMVLQGLEIGAAALAKIGHPAAAGLSKAAAGFQRQREEEEVDIPDNEETNAAAAKLQSIQRGKAARKEVEAKRAEKAPQAKA